MAQEIGFTHISLSSAIMPMIKMVPRGTSATADAYLTPCIKTYVDGFVSGFDKNLTKNVSLQFMQSDGGLVPVSHFSGLRAILSGPAGGVVGYGMTAFDPKDGVPVIGFDMGGTSTDVSRFNGKYEHVFETTTAGVTVQAPQLDINTVAAGGGSMLFFRNGTFVVGPEVRLPSISQVKHDLSGTYLLMDRIMMLYRRVLPLTQDQHAIAREDH